MLTRIRNSPIWRREATPASAGKVIGWWEIRRFPFNMIVGCAGIVTCVVILLIAIAASVFFDSDFGLPDPPIFAVFGVIFYAFMANLCFTGGWVTELAVRSLWPEHANQFAVWSFRAGMLFSVALTLAPAVVVGAVGFFLLIRHFAHFAGH